jgi:hypothetical protein
MKYFLFFVAIYSVNLLAEHPKKLEKAKRTINETANQVDRGVRNSIKEVKKVLGDKKK